MTNPLRRRLTRLACGLAFVAAAWVSAAQACSICIPYPTATHADLLLTSESVAFAREDPDEPFSYAPVGFLKGEADGQPIDLFLDSATRQRLRDNPGDAVVITRANAGAPWVRLAYATAAYQEVVAAILENAGLWWYGSQQQERLEFFTGQLFSADPTAREQAYLEIGRAPYTWIARVANSVPREDIRRTLADQRRIEWHSLYILMLAQSADPGDRAYIREQFETAARFGLTENLAAWTLAFAEAHPATAIGEIEETYFRDPARPREELEAVLQGLTIAASQSGVLVPPRIAELRGRLVRSYAVLIDRHPAMAGWVASSLLLWQLQAMVEPLSLIASDGAALDPASLFAVETYLAAAPDFPPPEPEGELR